MVNGSRYYRALESVRIASALSSALTIYPCQIRVHQTLTARKKEWWLATADSLPQAVTCQLCQQEISLTFQLSSVIFGIRAP